MLQEQEEAFREEQRRQLEVDTLIQEHEAALREERQPSEDPEDMLIREQEDALKQQQQWADQMEHDRLDHSYCSGATQDALCGVELEHAQGEEGMQDSDRQCRMERDMMARAAVCTQRLRMHFFEQVQYFHSFELANFGPFDADTACSSTLHSRVSQVGNRGPNLGM